MRRSILLITVLVGAITLAACGSSTGVLETVEPTEAADAIASDPDVVVLDIRTPDEYADGAIEGSLNIDFYDPGFASTLETLDPDTHYVVYCRSGNRSEQAMDTFADLGFAHVTEIDGGIVGWYGAGLPIVAPTS